MKPTEINANENPAEARKPDPPGRELTASEISHIPTLLLLSDRPLTTAQIARILDPDKPPGEDSITDELKKLRSRNLSRVFAGMELVEVAQGWRYQIASADGAIVHRLYNEKPPRYSRAVLETLAIIAWRGPVTRGDIENIRGVGLSPLIVRTLMDREWIVVKGHRETVGRPELLVTTKQFLDDFNLKSLDDLPSAEHLIEPEQARAEEASDLDDLRKGLGLFTTDRKASGGDGAAGTALSGQSAG